MSGSFVYANYNQDGSQSDVIPQAVNPSSAGGPFSPASPCLYWDFRVDGGRNGLMDKGASILTTGVGTAPTLPGTSPLCLFGAVAGGLQADMTSSAIALQKAIMRLDTLDVNSMIVFWALITHGTNFGTTGTIFSFGRSGDRGWGMQLFGSGANSCKAQWWHTPEGGSMDQYTFDSQFKLVGDLDTNSKSIMAGTITVCPTDPLNAGKGNGLFEINLHMAGLVDQGQFGQKQECLGFPLRVPNTGTGPAKFSTSCGITLGFRPTSSASTIADSMPNTSGFDCIGFQRRKRQGGFAAMICRQMRDNYIAAGANGFIQQPACLVP